MKILIQTIRNSFIVGVIFCSFLDGVSAQNGSSHAPKLINQVITLLQKKADLTTINQILGTSPEKRMDWVYVVPSKDSCFSEIKYKTGSLYFLYEVEMEYKKNSFPSLMDFEKQFHASKPVPPIHFDSPTIRMIYFPNQIRLQLTLESPSSLSVQKVRIDLSKVGN